MIVTEEEGKKWYNKNGISDEDWSNFNKTTKDLVRLEATLDKFDEIHHMRETGIPESAVLAFIKPGDVGLNKDTLSYINSDKDLRDIATYVTQNSTRNIKRIFLLNNMEVTSVNYIDDFIRLEVEPKI